MPTLDPKALALFEASCADMTPAEIEALRREVHAHVAEIHEAALDDEMLPVDIADALGRALDALLREAPYLAVRDRRLIVGAARYFISDEDQLGDTASILGLDDDVAVFNHAVRALGREKLVLDM